MKDIIDGLKAIIENPDDLSTLPDLIGKLEEVSTEFSSREEEYQERIMKLQDSNRNLLSQIPIAGAEPQKNEDDGKVTFEQAQEELIKAMQNVERGN